MKKIASTERRAFLKDHPPVMERKLIASTGEEATYVPGTVLGLKNGKYELWTTQSETKGICILAEDVIVPATGDVWALTYVHAAVLASELVWAEGVSATDQKKARGDLCAAGIYASEA